MKTITRYLPLLLAGLWLTGCGGDGSQRVTFPGNNPGGELFYTYPDAGQDGVSVHAPLVLRLSKPVVNGDSLDDSNVRLSRDGDDVPIDLELVSDDQSLVVRPQAPLAFGTTYRLDVTGLQGEAGPISIPGNGFEFTTRLADKGPKSLRVSSDQFVLTGMFPDGDTLPLLDFSTLRFQFSQPIDTASIVYGDSLALEDAAGTLVPATVLAKGRFLTIDPLEDLTAGTRYTLRFSGNVTSLYDAALQAPFDGGFTYHFLPGDTTPRETMVLRAPATGEPSQLTGETINLVPVIATLLGDETQSQQQGDIYNELAFVPNFPDATPLRIPRGSLLAGDALEVNIGGVVPAGFDSGEVVVRFVSDATGYLLPNPYSTAEDAPRQLRVFMDIAIATATPQANAAFNQDVLHLELIGQAIVEDGVLVADALTVVESEVLGLETAFGTLSFRMEAYDDQLNAPPQPEDTTPPQLQSWMPGASPFQENSDKQRPGDPIVLHFDEPLDPNSLDGQITVTEDGVPVAFDHYLDGVALVLRTDQDYGRTYAVTLGNAITDLAGNALDAQTVSFIMPTYAEGPAASPLPLTTYPGFPCVTTARDLANDNAGYCLGGMATDDRLRLPSMPANRDIEVRFSQVMNQDSFVLGQSVRVERVDANGTALGDVPGRLALWAREMRFIPDAPWEEGVLYRYTLASNGNIQGNACTPGSMICSEAGLPLKTRVLAQTVAQAPTLDGGGPNLEIYFRGAPATRWVRQPLGNLPTADVNSNTVRDPDEDNAVDNPVLTANGARLEVTGAGGAVTAAEVGCEPGEECPRDKYIYLTGTLNADVVGYRSPDELDLTDPSLPPEVVSNGGVLVYLYPTALQTTNVVVYADAAIGEADPASTGPQTMRMRATCDARSGGAPNPPHSAAIAACGEGEHGLVPGWIIEGNNGPEFTTSLNLYLDSPQLNPMVKILPAPLGDLLGIVDNLLGTLGGLLGLPQPPAINDLLAIPLTHNQRSYGFALSLRGPITFYDDGRMQIEQFNEFDVPLNVELSALGVLDAEVQLIIPAGGTNLNYISGAVKR
ncbi:hypothetical protein S7S_01015 [Isoalcanivorax pacificus W11-5]|uniref:SbsA Ig-like domain-containing protein n=1 Tax=Isoalcanivorax pacificus W11-5 TaxID=391936 RepID=A0A0B4XJM6_9GAMM|nr:Ig-like domain-containing protein [Isoalcanivorax pacificus]AJD46627.1 hypothetical protein S7S_01015 [Isoalcanivorax pacificus W11-5]